MTVAKGKNPSAAPTVTVPQPHTIDEASGGAEPMPGDVGDHLAETADTPIPPNLDPEVEKILERIEQAKIPPPGNDQAGNSSDAPVTKGAIPTAGVGHPAIPLEMPEPIFDGEIVQVAEDAKYVSRIRILEAWKYPGLVTNCPPYVDPSWAAWGEEDRVRGIAASPALRVPTPVGDKICRIGDYVVRQAVALIHGLENEQVEVWPRETFEKLFMPVGAALEGPTPPPIPGRQYTKVVNENAAKLAGHGNGQG